MALLAAYAAEQGKRCDECDTPERGAWEVLDGTVIDDAYEGSGVLNRPGHGSVVIDKEAAESLVADHNKLMQAAESQLATLREGLRKIRSIMSHMVPPKFVLGELEKCIEKLQKQGVFDEPETEKKES